MASNARTPATKANLVLTDMPPGRVDVFALVVFAVFGFIRISSGAHRWALVTQVWATPMSCNGCNRPHRIVSHPQAARRKSDMPAPVQFQLLG
jgi:hypothetical protein